jgi:hypothetical protein
LPPQQSRRQQVDGGGTYGVELINDLKENYRGRESMRLPPLKTPSNQSTPFHQRDNFNSPGMSTYHGDVSYVVDSIKESRPPTIHQRDIKKRVKANKYDDSRTLKPPVDGNFGFFQVFILFLFINVDVTFLN